MPQRRAPLLAGGIPDLQRDLLPVDLQRAALEVHTQRRAQVGQEAAATQAERERRLTDRHVACLHDAGDEIRLDETVSTGCLAATREAGRTCERDAEEQLLLRAARRRAGRVDRCGFALRVAASRGLLGALLRAALLVHTLQRALPLRRARPMRRRRDKLHHRMHSLPITSQKQTLRALVRTLHELCRRRCDLRVLCERPSGSRVPSCTLCAARPARVDGASESSASCAHPPTSTRRTSLTTPGIGGSLCLLTSGTERTHGTERWRSSSTSESSARLLLVGSSPPTLLTAVNVADVTEMSEACFWFRTADGAVFEQPPACVDALALEAHAPGASPAASELPPTPAPRTPPASSPRIDSRRRRRRMHATELARSRNEAILSAPLPRRLMSDSFA